MTFPTPPPPPERPLPVPPGQPSAVGPFIGQMHVRRAAKATLEKWGPFYIAEAVRQTGLDLPMWDQFINEPLSAPVTHRESPHYVVTAPSTLGQPERHGSSYRATWDVRVELWMWGANYQETEDKLGVYTTAVRQLFVQQPSLGKFAETTTWRAERYAQAGVPTTFRTWGQAVVALAVTVDGVVDVFAGPRQPPDDPTAPLAEPPRVTSTSVTVQPEHYRAP